MKLFELFLKIEKYLPKGIKEKLFTWMLKKKVKSVFSLKQQPETLSENKVITATQLGEMVKDPEFFKAIKKLQEDREKLWGINKK